MFVHSVDMVGHVYTHSLVIFLYLYDGLMWLATSFVFSISHYDIRLRDGQILNTIKIK
jgi:hypothetical protein